jgi:hemolysin activation/secretion protein
MSHFLLSRTRRTNRSARATLTVLLGLPLTVLAQSTPTSPQPVIEQQRQQERERALREQNERTVDERLPAAPVATLQRIPDNESPCFLIDRITLVGDHSESFQWALDSLLDVGGADGDGPLHRCLGTAGVNVVLARAQQALIARGWVTARVLAAPQDLSTGTLALTLVPGRIAAIRFTADSVLPSPLTGHATLASAVPASPGDLLNLRDIEQGLENFKRLPTVEADIQIEPSIAPDARPGDSDLVVKVVQKLPLRVALSLDDSGTKATGRIQTGATVSADNLLGLNDLFYVSGSHSLDNHFFSSPDHATESQTLHYSLPWGYWLLGITGSSSRYRQTVQGLSQDYTYAGTTQNEEVKLSRLIYRDQVRKTTMSVRAFRRESSNFIDDTEIENQHRTVSGWEASLNHREFLGEATLDGTLAYKRGTGAFGALPAPEESFGEGTSRMRMTTAEISLNAPFSLNLGNESAPQKLRYSGLVRAQWNATPLSPQDRFAIGGRYSVRGFDGETSLLGDRGWLIRNDVGLALGQSGAELYAGIDYGHVGGRSTVDSIGKNLAGGVIGVRGALGSGSRLSYDFFVGSPISKPAGYRTAGMTAGFNLNLGF